jgi:uncharacterized protein
MISELLWTLIAIQMVMGLTDTVYHHELTERLPWRTSQEHELRLHGLRNLLYALVFAMLGWSEVHGWFAVAAIAVLAAEVIITLLDFVEEDLTRKLPASERVLHTLLALNYGAILVLLLTVLIGWASEPTAIKPAFHGVWTILCSIAAAGTIVSGLRDYAAARRSLRLVPRPAEQLASALAERRSVLITGATGFIGPRLVEALTAAGHDVTVLTRDATKATALRPPFRVVTSLDQVPDTAHIDAIVNLAGEPITNWLWTNKKRQEIVRSRVSVTCDLVRLIARLVHRPAVLVSGSAIGWYGAHGDEILTEASAGVESFGHEVCGRWEAQAERATALGVRVVQLRIGLVLGVEGGVLGGLLTPFEFGLGGPIGSGRQWMPWIDRDDMVRLIIHAIATPELHGPVNATAPEPVRNATFTRELAHALHRPALMRLPATPLRVLGGQMAEELLLTGRRVVPEKALASGFVFWHPTLSGALAGLLGGGKRCTLPGARSGRVRASLLS